MANNRFKTIPPTTNIQDLALIQSNWDKTDTDLASVETRVTNIVAGAGSSNTEIVDARLNAATGVAFATIKERLDADSKKISGIWFNVKEYGAKGDGTDDTMAITAAIAACPPGGTVFFPIPIPALTAKYRCTQTIEITKPIKLMGFHKVYDVDGNLEQAGTIEFATGVFKGLHVTSYDVQIENLVVKMLDTSANLVAGIDLDSATGGGMRFTHLTNVFVDLPGFYGAGVRGRNLILSSFTNVNVFQGLFGFDFYGTGTSIKFDTCWARAQTAGGSGFRMNNYTYISFINTAADSVNNPDYGYNLIACKGISLTGVGSELMGKTMFKLDNCDGISINGSFAYNANRLGTAVATFAEIVNGTKNVTFTSCVDTTSPNTLPQVKIDATSKYPIMNNCDFQQGFSDNGTLIAPPANQAGYMQVGRTVIADNPAGSLLAVLYNRDFMIAGKKLGVAKSDLTGLLGYFDTDGGVVAAQYASNLVPVASATHRGKYITVLGNGTTTADQVWVCLISATGTYSWKTITTG